MIDYINLLGVLKMISNMFFSEDFMEGRDNSGNPVPTAIGPTSQFNIESFPTNYSFCLQVLLSDIDLSQETNLTVTFSIEDGEVLLASDTINLPKADEDKLSVNFNLNFRNARIEKEGTYIARLFYKEVPVNEVKVNFFKKREE